MHEKHVSWYRWMLLMPLAFSTAPALYSRRCAGSLSGSSCYKTSLLVHALLTTTTANTNSRLSRNASHTGNNNNKMNDATTTGAASCSSLSLVDFYKLDSVQSTQEEARKLLSSSSPSSSSTVSSTSATINNHRRPYLAVTAKEQHAGRGTSGRVWKGRSGNVFLTLAFPMQHIVKSKCLTLLPLQVGVIIAKTLERIMLLQSHKACSCSSSADASSADVDTTRDKEQTGKQNARANNNNDNNNIISLKWPNDVLLDQKKVAGVLIENELAVRAAGGTEFDTYLLVGIGINVQQAPNIAPDEGRPATSLADYCRARACTSSTPASCNDDDESADATTKEQANDSGTTATTTTTTTNPPVTSVLPDDTADIVATEIVEELVTWLEALSTTASTDTTTAAASIVHAWNQWADFGTPQTLRETGEVVVPLRIQQDGQLLVRQENGQERLLMAEYLY